MSCLRLNSFLSKTIKMESSNGIFICPGCDKYSTNSNQDFVTHLNENHSSFDTVQCIYCNKIVHKHFIIQHTKFHYRSDVKSKLKCKVCDENVSIACLDNIFDHIMHFHRDFTNCVNCDEQFNSEVNLINHIQQNFSRLYHCQNSNCKLKTESYNEILDHMKFRNHLDFNLENIMICNPTKVELFSDPTPNKFVNNCKVGNQDSPKAYAKQLTDELICNITLPEKAVKFSKMNVNRKVIQEIYELIFLKEDFLRSNFIQCNDVDLMNKLSSIEKHKIGKPGQKEHKIYYCMSCSYASCHSFNDVKKHILSQHCFVHHTDIPANMSFISHHFQHQLYPQTPSSSSALTTLVKTPISEVKKASRGKQNDVVRTSKYHSMGIPYSRRAFDIVYANETDLVKQELLKKLVQLENCRIKVNTNVKPKVFFCGHCDFESNHSIVDVKRHIMRRHCYLVDTLIPDFCKLTKVDNQWNILSDETIVDLFEIQNCNNKNRIGSKTNAIVKKLPDHHQHQQQKSSDDREIVALKNIRDRKRKSVSYY